MKVIRSLFMIVGILLAAYGTYGYHLGRISSMPSYGRTRLLVGDAVFGEALGYIVYGIFLFFVGLILLSEKFRNATEHQLKSSPGTVNIPEISEEMEYVIERRRKQALLKKLFSSPIFLTIFVSLVFFLIFGIIRAFIWVR